MDIVYVKIDDLKFAEYNPRTLSDKQFEDIKKSLQEFGFVDPIIVNKNQNRFNIIIGGHQRVKVARALKHESVPVFYVDLPKTKEKELNIRLNKNTGQWDWKLLKDEFELDDLLDWGFDDDEFNFDDDEDVEHGETQGDDNVTASDKNNIITKKGDVWELGKHRLLCGDSTISDDVDKLLNNNNPILMVTDPPYGVNYDPEWRDGYDLGVGERSKGKVQNDDKVNWIDAYSLFKGNVTYVWHAGKYCLEVAQDLKDCGFDIINQLIWVKQHFVLSRGDYHWQHEPCFYAVKKGCNHNWQGARDQATTWQIKNNNSFGNPDKEKTVGHGTQKPLECMLRPILNNSLKGQSVYDPFLGSGTTVIACEKSNRICFGMEIDEYYCDMIIKRYIDFCKINEREVSVKLNGENFDVSKFESKNENAL